MPKTTFELTEKKGLNFTETTVHIPFGDGKTLELSTGKLAKQAHGAVYAKVGGTVVLAAAVMDNKPTEKDFFPLMVDYREKFYAAGRIPGGFFKRETRPSDGETLKARLTDRTLRPMFPEGFKNEVQIYILVLAMDLENPAELVAMCAASAALHISEVPFVKPIAGVRVGRLDGKIVLNPSMKDFENLEMNLIVAGHRDGINMVEAGAKEMPETEIVAGLEEAHRAIRVVTDGIEELRRRVGQPKHAFTPAEKDKALEALVAKLSASHIKEIADTHEKNARDARLNRAVDEVHAALGDAYADRKKEVASFVHTLDENAMRERVVKHGIRADGRRPNEIRPIWSEIDVLPSVHGSAVFTRGQTQALSVCTLGTSDDAQMIDDMTGTSYKRFYLHYNFPSFSVGECRPPRGPGRREIGHGMLAERAVEAVIPPKEAFPYTIRTVVDILESNGSSSMATVCSSSMAMMDAGVPLIRPVAGIAMGLIESEVNGKKSSAIISDIQGIEDHCGDMDFKVCGTEVGITALQMDIKTEGVTSELLSRALDQAREGRLFILDKMAETITAGREQMKPQTPRMTILKVPVENIREIIGSGGKVIRGITEATGAKIDIEDDGTVYVMGSNAASADAAIAMIDDILRVIEEGEIFTGKVIRVLESGAIVGLPGGKDGMIHISELEHRRVDKVEDVLNLGDEVTVKVVEIDKMRGRIRLSRKALIDKPEGGGGGGGRGGDDEGGDRGGDRGPRPERTFDRGPRGGGGSDRPAGPRGGDRGPDGGNLRPRRPRPPRDRE